MQVLSADLHEVCVDLVSAVATLSLSGSITHLVTDCNLLILGIEICSGEIETGFLNLLIRCLPSTDGVESNNRRLRCECEQCDCSVVITLICVQFLYYYFVQYIGFRLLTEYESVSLAT